MVTEFTESSCIQLAAVAPSTCYFLGLLEHLSGGFLDALKMGVTFYLAIYGKFILSPITF